MFHDVKETCTEAMSSSQGHELSPILPLRTTHKVPVTVQRGVEERGCLLISMTFYEFSKTWSQYP